MRYQFTYRMTAIDFWKLSMYYIYGSIVGVCNILFTVGMAAVMAARWDQTTGFWRVFLVLGFFLFPVIQPLAVYVRAKKQASVISQDTTVSFLDQEIHVEMGDKTQQIKWDKIRRISKKPGMVVVFSDTTHGFVLTNRVLGSEKEAFYQYLTTKVKYT